MKKHLTHSALVLALLAPLAGWAQVSVSINVGPPPLLAYSQPMVPGDGYIWTPGYWAWSRHDHAYYWVPGTWVLAPSPGYLWTPGYWAFGQGGYLWNQGYWGLSVGFYGGINYGYGYGGYGYDGGRWNGDVFSYNRAYNNVNPTVVRSVYSSRTVSSNYVPTNSSHVSVNGGRGGSTARPNATQLQVQHAQHSDPTPVQLEHERTALTSPTQRATGPHSAPEVVATPRPTAFTEPGVVHSRGAEPVINAQPSNRGGERQSRQAPEPQAQQRPAPQPQAQERPAPPPQAQQRQAPPPQQQHAQQQQGQPPQGERRQSRGQGEERGKDKRD